MSRILEKLFSTFIFPRISVRFFILHNRSLRSAILLSNNVRTIVFGAASTVESETSPFFFLSFFVFSVRFRWEKGVDITIREPFSSARVPTRNNDGAFGIRNCANCSFSFGDYRRDTRGGITTSFSRKKMKRTNLSGRSDPFAATWCVFVLSCRSFWFLFTFLSILLVQKKKKEILFLSCCTFFPFIQFIFCCLSGLKKRSQWCDEIHELSSIVIVWWWRVMMHVDVWRQFDCGNTQAASLQYRKILI